MPAPRAGGRTPSTYSFGSFGFLIPGTSMKPSDPTGSSLKPPRVRMVRYLSFYRNSATLTPLPEFLSLNVNETKKPPAEPRSANAGFYFVQVIADVELSWRGVPIVPDSSFP